MAQLASSSFGDLLAGVERKTPTPGGGAVAGCVGALAAALGGMVVAYSLGRKELAAFDPELRRAADALRRAKDVLLELADEDAEAYRVLSDLMKLPESDARRAADFPAAVQSAIGVPRAVIATSSNLLRLLESLVPISNKRLRSDLAIAAVLADATARASRWNVEINLPLLSEDAQRTELKTQTAAALRDAADRAARIERACV
jgi:formiminotetrahydrofolate cyclodeaminase